MDRVIVIDADVELCGLVARHLEADGFQVEVVHDGAQGVDRALSDEHALVVLDVMLPTLGGFEVLRRIRAVSRIPVLLLTTRGDDVDNIAGLEKGIGNYLPKPFNPRELPARVRAMLRRAKRKAGWHPDKQMRGVITVEDLEFDREARLIRRTGKIIKLTPTEFELLDILLTRAGQVVSREQLSRKVLRRKFTPEDHSLVMQVSNLRKKLGLRPDGTDRIKAVPRVGYIYVV